MLNQQLHPVIQNGPRRESSGFQEAFDLARDFPNVFREMLSPSMYVWAPAAKQNTQRTTPRCFVGHTSILETKRYKTSE